MTGSFHEAHARASELGRQIFRYIREGPAGKAVRHRREHIAQWIDRIAADGSKPSVLAIAAGHLREAEISEAVASARIDRFVALDADVDSLREVETCYAGLGVETLNASVRHILGRRVRLGTFDFVYAAGLFDYLNDNIAKALGGWMMIPNFAPTVWDRGHMETFMNWHLIYRDEFLQAGPSPYRKFSNITNSEAAADVVTTMRRPSGDNRM